DYISQQVKIIGESILGNRLHIYPPLPVEEALEVAHHSNVVMCCSLNETFGLYIAEGMAMGHVVLRNDSAGVDEQLSEGENGFLIEADVDQIASRIEKLLNKSTSNEELWKMGGASQKIASKYLHN